ncbi:restriction endonuclease [Candidatus Gracilibacteria bacterium]|nr:restriction endonuclease [Candidatus Gracilibacteria bacterium]
MYLLDKTLATLYSSASQRVRVMTESWAEEYGYCPNCGNNLTKSRDNNPVGDFICLKCSEEYELKSKNNTFGRKITDGAYGTMIERLGSATNPSFFGLNYSNNLEIINFFVIPKFYFTSEIIEKRKPLSPTARRAGWIGCNILLEPIPESGKIYYIQNGKSREKGYILDDWQKTNFLAEKSTLESKGWLLDIMRCIDMLGKKEFSLAEIYDFTSLLKEKHPDNNNIEAKIRQQLQILRDKKYLEFGGRGIYKVI